MKANAMDNDYKSRPNNTHIAVLVSYFILSSVYIHIHLARLINLPSTGDIPLRRFKWDEYFPPMSWQLFPRRFFLGDFSEEISPRRFLRGYENLPLKRWPLSPRRFFQGDRIYLWGIENLPPMRINEVTIISMEKSPRR